jgi:hypothetical protein
MYMYVHVHVCIGPRVYYMYDISYSYKASVETSSGMKNYILHLPTPRSSLIVASLVYGKLLSSNIG